MILNKAYNEIMEKIEVTDEMRKRVLENIEVANTKIPHKYIRFSGYKKVLTIAACLVVMLIGAIALPQLLKIEKNPPPPILTTPNATITECATLQELSSAVGFSVYELSDIPFEPTKVTYKAYFNKLAEISYGGEIQNAVFRMAVGDEDISGDFNTYSSAAEITVQSNAVQIKGDDEMYSLAIWSDEKYSYSIKLTSGISEEGWRSFLEQFSGK